MHHEEELKGKIDSALKRLNERQEMKMQEGKLEAQLQTGSDKGKTVRDENADSEMISVEAAAE